MPDANPRLMTIFSEALEQPDPAARTAYLDRVCAGDAHLRRRVEALLTAHDGAGRFLEPDSATVLASPTLSPPDVTGTFAPDAHRPSVMVTGEYSPDPATVGFESTPTAGHLLNPAVAGVIAGRYTLAGVIGEGGMGTVYRAEQTEPVKRQVALKLIKIGMDSRAVLARFDAERQALALMDHPNIARVYDGGTTETGQPFFVMELVQGVPITEYCDRARFPVRARLELFVLVCHAVQHAHQKGIIHRDLKPGNVLVTEVDGRPTPKVIDFGVAKATEQRLTDQSLADTGAIVGTPAYMSPEQADPSSMDIDTRTDVYALGVILYELLVGSPPIDAKQFQRGAILEMLRMVREVDPPRPSTKLSTTDALPNIAANRNLEPAQLKRAVRGDLDWIVMKSLEKDRTRRYDTANGFAADVLRHLSYEPVLAAPPSRAYRIRKFVRKHRGAVLAASVIVLALLAGIAGTTWGLILADHEAGNAHRSEADAKQREADAIAARNALGEANAALRESTDNLLSTAARSLLRPLAVQVQPNKPLPPLNDHEIEPLWELASLKEEPLRLRFVEIALRDPITTRRLKDRAAISLHATVGLDRERRKQVEGLLSKNLQANDISEEQQENVALCLARLGGLDRLLAGRTATTLTQAMTRTTDWPPSQSLREGLSVVAAQMEPKDAAILFTQAMTKTTEPEAMHSLSQCLSAVATRMDPKAAAQVCGEAAATLTQAMTKTTDPRALWSLGGSLSAVAAHMDLKNAAQTCGHAVNTLTQAMTQTTDSDALVSLSYGLSAVAAFMEPKDATQTCGHAAYTLTMAMNKTTDAETLISLSSGLVALVTRMDPKDVTKTFGHAAITLTQAMSQTNDDFALRWLSSGLPAVAARMDPKDAGKAAASLTQAMTKTTDPSALFSLSQGLSAVAARMDPKDAAETAAALTQALTKTAHQNALENLSRGLSAVAARMDPKDAGKAAASLTQAMTKTTDPNALFPLSSGLSAVAARMDPKDAAETAAALTQAMTKATEPNALQSLAQGLSAVASRMEPKEAALMCGQAAAALTQAMTKTTEPNALQSLAQGLSAVAARMDPKGAAETAAALTQAMTKTTDPNALGSLSQGLSGVAVRMETKEAAQVCGQAAATLTQAMTNTNARLNDLATNPSHYVLQGLSAVAAHMEPKDASTTLTQTMTKTTERFALQQLSQSLAAVVARMDPKDAALTCGHVANTLTQAMTKTTSQYALQQLSKSLSEVSARMDPKGAAQACGEAAATLTQAMTKTTDPDALGSLSQGLSAVAACMDPRDAAQACGEAAVTLTQAMTKATNGYTLQSLSEGLSAVLSREESLTRRQRLMNLTGTVAALGGPGPPFAALAWAQPALKPLPPPLPPQTLVDLLKNPFCVGEAQRLVLEQLTRHYNRPFADQWEFVDYVHTHKLDLDLTTPPERPKGMP